MSANHFKIRDYIKPKRALNGTKIDAYSADLRDVWLKEIQGRFPNATEEDIFGEHKIYEN